MNKVAEKYDEALRTIPAPGGAGCHVAILGVANLGIMAGLSDAQVVSDIRRSIPQGTRSVPESEIVKSVAKARDEVIPADVSSDRPAYKPEPPRKPLFDGIEHRQRIIEKSRGATEAELWEASPYRIDGEPGVWDAVTLLETLYAPDELLFIGDIYGKEVHPAAFLISQYKSGYQPEAHIIPNPFTGEQSPVGGGKYSKRCDAAVSAHRFALIEFDNLPREDQICFWHTMLLQKYPVAALIDSGGKSIHAWIRVALSDRASWDKHVKIGLYDKFTGRMALMGADRACQNPSRLSRMPGHFRGDKGKWQRLLYLNPHLTTNR